MRWTWSQQLVVNKGTKSPRLGQNIIWTWIRIRDMNNTYKNTSPVERTPVDLNEVFWAHKDPVWVLLQFSIRRGTSEFLCYRPPCDSSSENIVKWTERRLVQLSDRECSGCLTPNKQSVSRSCRQARRRLIDTSWCVRLYRERWREHS